jgi:hypothetical protein
MIKHTWNSKELKILSVAVNANTQFSPLSLGKGVPVGFDPSTLFIFKLNFFKCNLIFQVQVSSI